MGGCLSALLRALTSGGGDGESSFSRDSPSPIQGKDPSSVTKLAEDFGYGTSSGRRMFGYDPDFFAVYRIGKELGLSHRVHFRTVGFSKALAARNSSGRRSLRLLTPSL